jgi:hypothetical protein
MKTIILKKMMPIAVFVLGIFGALITTSMQSATKTVWMPVQGFVNLPNDPCQLPVECSAIGSAVCRLNFATGPRAYAKDSPTACMITVFRPGSYQ